MSSFLEPSIIGGVKVGLDQPVRVMGVINLSPESFYRGSIARSVDEAFRMAVSMVDEGVDFIDIGGMSTAPYKETYVPVEVEAERVKPVILELSKSIEVPISIDTRRSRVAEIALEAGASIVNDTSGLKHDGDMVRVVRDHDASVILMAYGDVSDPSDPVRCVRRLLMESIDIAVGNGVSHDRIVVDPGIGFFRDTGIPWYEWDSKIIRGIRRLHILGRPIMIGVSRKSFIGRILGKEDPGERLIGSVAAESISVYNGVSMVRTHNVRETIQAIRLAEYIRPRIRIVRHRRLKIVDFDSILYMDDVRDLMHYIDVDESGIEIMAGKGEHRVIYIEGIPRLLSIVLKQEMLAIGGEAATPKDAIFSGFSDTSVILMGTMKQYGMLIGKLKRMDFRSLRDRGLINSMELAEILEEILT